jgi:hypothetical protein
MNKLCRALGVVIPWVFILSPYALYSQEEPSPVHVGINLVAGIPGSGFREAVDNNLGGLGVGPGLYVLVNPFGKQKPSHVYLGLDLQYLYFGRDKVAETSVAPPYKTSFNYYSVDGIARIFPMQRSGFNIFLDGMLGLKIMNARTKIDKNAIQTIIADEQEEVINNATDSGLGYGVGVGFYSKRYDEQEGSKTGLPSLSLRVVYMWGDKVSYVKRGSINVDNGFVTYQQGYARTDMIQIQLGMYIF